MVYSCALCGGDIIVILFSALRFTKRKNKRIVMKYRIVSGRRHDPQASGQVLIRACFGENANLVG
jgi:hypothetical protein